MERENKINSCLNMIELWMKRETEQAWPIVHIGPVRHLRVSMVVVHVLLSMVVGLVAGAAAVERVQGNPGRRRDGVPVRGQRVQRIEPEDYNIRRALLHAHYFSWFPKVEIKLEEKNNVAGNDVWNVSICFHFDENSKDKS